MGKDFLFWTTFPSLPTFITIKPNYYIKYVLNPIKSLLSFQENKETLSGQKRKSWKTEQQSVTNTMFFRECLLISVNKRLQKTILEQEANPWHTHCRKLEMKSWLKLVSSKAYLHTQQKKGQENNLLTDRGKQRGYLFMLAWVLGEKISLENIWPHLNSWIYTLYMVSE